MTIQSTRLGATGLRVSRLALGTMTFGLQTDEAVSHRILDKATDAGINLLYTAAWYQMDILPARSVGVPPAPARLYGPLCMAIDVVRYSVDLPPLALGDVLTLHPVGAYNVVQSMQFIEYRPAVVMISGAGKPVLVRARETLADVEGPERMPAHLAAR